jgi:SAM-dependent methyltransferase
LEIQMLNHALRYAAVVSILGDPDERMLLEVGSGSRGIAAYLSSGWELTACDVSFDDFGSGQVGGGRGARRVTASVLSLPFPDASFDVVVALDLLEHLTREDRPKAVSELRRVARRKLIIGCPCGDAAEGADRRLADLYRRRRKPVPVWLTEHLDHGLPQTTDLVSAARRHDTITVVPHAAIRNHARVLEWEAGAVRSRIAAIMGTTLSTMIRQPGASRRIATAITAALAGRDRVPVYRQIAVIEPADGIR